MILRCAFFKGQIKPGKKAEFDAHIETKLVPLWSAFPHLIDLRVLREVESDDPENRFELVLFMQFPSKEAITEALASPVRWESKETSKYLLERFDGTVIHTVFEAGQFPPMPR